MRPVSVRTCDCRAPCGCEGLDLGRAFVDLVPLLGRVVDLGVLPALHEEISLGLAQAKSTYTGGSHRSMGIVPPSRRAECLVDYGEVLESMTDAQRAIFASLSDEPERIDLGRRQTFGEEREVPLSHRQMRWLEIRFGVYFPWKTYVELMPGGRWDDKADARGKRWTREAQLLFPNTVAFVRALPFTSIGSVKILGLSPHDHGTVHHDGDPEGARATDEFVTFCPAADKKLFLWDEAAQQELDAPSNVYWFDDRNPHGVRAAPHFRCSIRVDGTFTTAFREMLRRSDG